MSDVAEKLPGSWENVRLGDFVESSKGKKPTNQKKTQDKKFCFPYIDIEAFEKGLIKSYSDGLNCRFCSISDFLMVWDGSRSGLVGRGMDGALGSTLVRINFPGILNDYAYYFLQSKFLQINSRAKGSGTPHVDPDLLWGYRFMVPPYAEQKRIVAKIEQLFAELDKGIESLLTAREQLKVYRQSLLKHAFEGKLTKQWREDNATKLETAGELLARIQQERTARYQQQLESWGKAVVEWEKGKSGRKPSKPRQPKALVDLEESVIKGLSGVPEEWLWNKVGWMTLGVEYGTSAKSSKTGDCAVLRMGNIQNSKFEWGDLVYTSDKEEIGKYILAEGDVLFNRTNSPELVGKSALYRGEYPAAFAGYLIRVNHFKNIVSSQYLNLFLNSHIAKQYGNTVKTDGVNQSNINGEKLSNYPFPYCSLEEQVQIVKLLDSLLSEIDKSMSDIDANEKRSQALRQSILKKAFSGQLVPQDTNDEPASELLKRIAAEKAVLESAAKSAKTAAKTATKKPRTKKQAVTKEHA